MVGSSHLPTVGRALARQSARQGGWIEVASRAEVGLAADCWTKVQPTGLLGPPCHQALWVGLQPDNPPDRVDGKIPGSAAQLKSTWRSTVGLKSNPQQSRSQPATEQPCGSGFSLTIHPAGWMDNKPGPAPHSWERRVALADAEYNSAIQ